MMLRAAAPTLIAILAAACAHTGAPVVVGSPASRPAASAGDRAAPRPAAGAHVRLQMEPIRLEAAAVRRAAGEGQDGASALFERAGQLLSGRKHGEALAAYDRLLREFPTSRLASPSLYNAGLAHEWKRDFSGAAARYRELIRRFGSSKEAVDAGFRLGGCYAELRNWPASAQAFGELVRRKELSASDRIEALARRALAFFRLGDARACRSALQEAIEFHRRIETVERLDTDFFLGMVHYYQAALPHLEFRNLKLDAAAQAELARTLDEKARLLLLSQTAYIKAIHVKNPYWATAAGFQIGSLYKEFYTVLLTTLPDFTKAAEKNAKTAKVTLKVAQQQLVQAYLEEVHRTVKPLLNKAIRVFEKNVLVGQKIGVQSEWIGKSRYQINELKHLLSLPPGEAVKLVTKSAPAPDEQPASDKVKPPLSSPDKAPARPTDKPQDADDDDEPGRVVL